MLQLHQTAFTIAYTCIHMQYIYSMYFRFRGVQQVKYFVWEEKKKRDIFVWKQIWHIEVQHLYTTQSYIEK